MSRAATAAYLNNVRRRRHRNDGGSTPVAPPANTVAPSISGTPTSGQTLTANDGTWSGSPTLTRQWKADGVAVSGQTGATLLLGDTLIGKSITVTVTGSNDGGSASATSAAVGPVVAAAVALDPAISQSMVDAGLVHHAFFFDRHVAGYNGKTVRMKRLSDNAQQDFGFAADTGIFDLAAVHTWRSGADVDIVNFIDQKPGSTKVLPVAYSVASFIRSGAVSRPGSVWDAITGQLTRHADNGAVGCNVSAAAFQMTGSSLKLSEGGEVHMLYSPNKRKTSTNGATNPTLGDDEAPLDLQSSATRENILCLGFNTNNQAFYQLGGGTSTGHLLRLQTGGAQINPSTAGPAFKKNSQHVASFRLSAAGATLYAFGQKALDGSNAAAAQTAIAAGSMDNVDIVVGTVFSSSTTNALRTTADLMDGWFGGILVTPLLTDFQRYLVQSKFCLAGQQHRRKSKADLLAIFDVLAVCADTDANGLLADRKGKTSIQFNKTTVAEGTPDFDFAYTVPGLGLKGVRSPTVTNFANGYQATNNYLAEENTLTLVSMHQLESSAQNGSLQWAWSFGEGALYNDTSRGDWSWALGYNHNQPDFIATWPASRDPSDLMGRRVKADGTPFGYDLLNQEIEKYNHGTPHTTLVYGESYDGMVWTRAKLANELAGQTYYLDAPVKRRVPENLKFPFKPGPWMIQVATSEPPAGWDRNADYATRSALRLKAKNRSYLACGPMPIGHVDGSVSVNDDAAVIDSSASGRIQSAPWQYPFVGSRLAFAAKKGVAVPMSVAEEIALNMYKIYDTDAPIGSLI